MTALCMHTELLQHTTVTCIICLAPVPLKDATAGSIYNSGRQAFACDRHLTERAAWITAWALFDHQQKQKMAIAFIEAEA